MVQGGMRLKTTNFTIGDGPSHGMPWYCSYNASDISHRINTVLLVEVRKTLLSDCCGLSFSVNNNLEL